MMKSEFEQIAGYEVSDEDYNNIIEPMYMAVDLDKREFVKVIDRKRFEVKHEKTAEQLQVEEDVKKQIAELQGDLQEHIEDAKRCELFYKEDGDKYWQARTKHDKEIIAVIRAKIKGLKLILA